MKKYARLTESDLHLRKPNKKYERMRELEMRALNVANKRKNLKIYVLSSGIVYGNGEDILFDLFKKAWMKPDEELPIIGDGSNIIPMIHVADLAELV